MPHVLMLNPAAKKPRRKTRKVVRGPRGTQGKKIVIDNGGHAGLKTAPKGVYTVNKIPRRNARGQFVKNCAHRATKSSHRTYRHRSTESHAARVAAARKGWRTRRGSYRCNPESRTERSRAAKKGWRGRRNPIGRGGVMELLRESLMPAMAFPASALVNDLVYGFIPMPAMLKAGLWKPVGQIGVAGVLGILASFALPARVAPLVMGGMLGGVLLDTGREYLKNTFPTLALSGVDAYPAMSYEGGNYSPGYLGAADPAPQYLGQSPSSAPDYLGAYVENSMGAYVGNS